jgi:hypothetical protein
MPLFMAESIEISRFLALYHRTNGVGSLSKETIDPDEIIGSQSIN